ncbi:MAG: DNA/RNA non-specific endonuclease [Prevotella sp.]|nr:DNA/RNA non-specific endonuclease [Prevotella sp.]
MKKFIIVFILVILFLAVVIGNCSDDSIEIDEPITYLSSTDDEKNQDNKNEKVQAATLSIDTRNVEVPASSHFVDEQILSRKAYTTSYNCRTKCPNWVAWHLTSEHIDGPFSRKGVPYYSNDGIVEGIGYATQETCRNGYFVDLEAKEPRQQLSDWTRDYNMSHGHMCPAGDNKWDKAAMNQSFLLTNMCPQDEKLNGGGWKKLEEKCRIWANQYGSIYIVAGPIFNESITRTLGEGKIAVPDAFFKVVLCLEGTPKAIGFLYKNDSSSQSIRDCACSVDNIEELTGLDFFYSLPDDIENIIESDSNPSKWN